MPPAVPVTPKRRRVRTPTVLQMEAVECGAAALGIVLGYFGRFVPLELLRQECGVSRDGSKASNMLSVARKYGLEAHGYKKEPADLSSLPLPQIIFWEFNHFAVVEGFGRGKVFLNDPAVGRRVVTEGEFDESFTGVVLTFTPTASFTRGGRPPSVWRSLVPRLAGFRGALVFLFLVSLALVIPGLVAPGLSSIFVDDVLVGGNSDWLRPLLLALGVTALVQAGLLGLQTYYLTRLQVQLTLRNSCKFFWHVLSLPIEFFQQRYAGDVSSRVGSNNRVAGLLSAGLTGSLVNVVMIVFYAVVMAWCDIALTLVGIATALLNLGMLWWMAARLKTGYLRLSKDLGKLTATTMGGLQTIETLKASGSEQDFFTRWAGCQARVNTTSQELGASSACLSAVPLFLTGLCNLAVLGLGGLRVMDGDLTLGMLVAFQGLMGTFLQPVNHLVGFGSSLQQIQADLNRLDDVEQYGRSQESETLPAPGAAPTPDLPVTGRVDLIDITFGYSRLAEPLIAGFHLTIPPGRRVAVVGDSGSGRSTLARIVSGLLTPWTGTILIDGRPRAEWPRDRLAGAVAVVDQDILLFAGTVRENLTLWDTTVPEPDLIQATKDACIHDDIMARPKGYDSRVEEGGANFSGGQRQRLEIARALASNPAVLILDEATSALDPYTEMRVDDALRRRGCTCLLVAHRLSTIRDCDEIIVLERGRVVQRGTHDEMKQVDGPYRRLIQVE